MSNRPPARSALRYPLDGILGNQAHVRVLREIYDHGGHLTVGDLTRRTGLSGQGVRNSLAELQRWGVIAGIGPGKGRLFFATPHPLAGPLRDLFKVEDERVGQVIERLRGVIRRSGPGIIAAWLHGSVARGDDSPESDIDLVIVADAARRADIAADLRDQLYEVARDLQIRPELQSLDEQDIRRLSSGDPWWRELERDAHVLLGDRPDVLAAALRRSTSKRAARAPK